MLKAIYRTKDLQEAIIAFQDFQQQWKRMYPSIVHYWAENFPHLTRFLSLPRSIRPYLYTTNYLERLSKEIKRRAKTIEIFCSEDSLINLLYIVMIWENEKLQSRRLIGFSSFKALEEGETQIP
jgi:transposase-like protein